MIHENDVVCILGCFLQGFPAALRRIYFDSGIPQELDNHHQIHGIVVHDQNACVRRDKALAVDGAVAGLFLGGEVDDADGAHVDNALLHFHGEGGTLVIDAVYADFAAHHLHKLPGYVQTEPGSLNMSVI